MRIMPSMTAHSNRSKFKTGNPSLRLNNVLFAKRHINTCTTTTAKNAPNCCAKSARQLFRLIIVIKEQSKPNIIVRIVTAHCSAGKSVSTSLCTNAATITAHTESTHSNNSIPQNKISDNQNLLSSNFVTFTANTCSKLKILLCHHP